MKDTTIVAILLLLTSNPTHAASLQFEINQIESKWAHIYYTQTSYEQSKNYPTLLKKLKHTLSSHPHSNELKIWQAIIISTYAAYQAPFTALESINKAKSLLEESIKSNPHALAGAAHVTLGTLYYMTPGWPISFGNERKAEQLLKTGLKLNPDSIDSHYFYADYLLTIDRQNEAAKHFQIAANITSRPKQLLADNELKKEASLALLKTKRKLNSGKNRFLSLFSLATRN